MHVLIAPDKFKDALSAEEAARVMASGLKAALPDATYTLLPLADGGEGTAALLTRLNNGIMRHMPVGGPGGKSVNARWGYSAPLKQAYLELAEASGLQLLAPGHRNPLYTTTYGTGELLATALQQGATSLILGLGGSASNDGGTGMAAALGYEFLDQHGKALSFLSGQHLSRIHRISTNKVNRLLFRCCIRAACDVTNPLCGPRGATYTFATQKGARAEDLPQLEEGLLHLAEVIRKELGIEVQNLAGSGAAGGSGAGVVAFLQGRLQNGTELILEKSGFEEKLEQADLLLTGEGRFDAGSLHGKLIGKLCEFADKKGKRVVAFCGSADPMELRHYPKSLQTVKTIAEKEASLFQNLKNSEVNLRRAVEAYFSGN